jgi:wyosine [tRNA(Phe)-imidazoG37] synthetase (radical SAM superfamily)
MKGGYQYIFGPVSSWRLGSSLGIDLLSQERKICNFDCLYCQLGGTHAPTKERRLYIPTDHALAEVGGLPADVAIDTITFSGMGKPTLALNLGETILAVKAIRREPVAVLTNTSLMGRDGVREELSYADIVVAKMDVCSQIFLQRVNRPAPLPPESVGEIVRFFRAFRTCSVYECERPSVLSLSPEETLRRRGNVI